jgi:hypothetical protein
LPIVVLFGGLFIAADAVLQAARHGGGAGSAPRLVARVRRRGRVDARRGFFELVAVSLLVLPVVLGANALVRDRLWLVRSLSALLVASFAVGALVSRAVCSPTPRRRRCARLERVALARARTSARTPPRAAAPRRQRVRRSRRGGRVPQSG